MKDFTAELNAEIATWGHYSLLTDCQIGNVVLPPGAAIYGNGRTISAASTVDHTKALISVGPQTGGFETSTFRHFRVLGNGKSMTAGIQIQNGSFLLDSVEIGTVQQVVSGLQTDPYDFDTAFDIQFQETNQIPSIRNCTAFNFKNYGFSIHGSDVSMDTCRGASGGKLINGVLSLPETVFWMNAGGVYRNLHGYGRCQYAGITMADQIALIDSHFEGATCAQLMWLGSRGTARNIWLYYVTDAKDLNEYPGAAGFQIGTLDHTFDPSGYAEFNDFSEIRVGINNAQSSGQGIYPPEWLPQGPGVNCVHGSDNVLKFLENSVGRLISGNLAVLQPRAVPVPAPVVSS